MTCVKKVVQSPGNQTQRLRSLDHRGLARRPVEGRVATVVPAIPARSIVWPEPAHDLAAERNRLPRRTQKVKQRTQLDNRRRINDILALESIRSTWGAKNEPKLRGLSIAEFAGRLVPNTGHESATSSSCGGPSRGRVQQWTSAGKTPKKPHFVSLFCPPGVTSRWQISIGKSSYAK
jgi:hypothetical protein